MAAYTLKGPATDLDTAERALVALAGVCVVAIALCARPAWPLSLGLAATCFSGHWDDMGVPVPLDRVLIGTAIVSTLVRARARSPYALRTRPIDWLLAVAAVYAIGSVVLAGTWDDSTARFALIDRYSLLGFVLFFVAPKAYREARDRQVLLGVLVVLGAYLGLTALFETTGPDALVVPSYIKDPAVGTHIDRARGPFVEAAANGLILFACAMASVLAAWTWRGRRRRQLAALIAGLCALGVVLTVTRAAWIASAVAALVTAMSIREGRRIALPAAAAIGLGVLVAFAAIPGLQGRASDRTDDKKPIWDRENSNAAATRMLAEKPLFGFGWGRFATDSGDYYRQSQDIPLTGVRDLHNVYLSNAVELGLLGGALWLFAVGTALVGTIARRGPPELRPWRIGLIALVVSVGLSALSTPFGFALPTLLLWTWAGVARGEDYASPHTAATTRVAALPSSSEQNRSAKRLYAGA